MHEPFRLRRMRLAGRNERGMGPQRTIWELPGAGCFCRPRRPRAGLAEPPTLGDEPTAPVSGYHGRSALLALSTAWRTICRGRSGSGTLIVSSVKKLHCFAG